ncbi:unnamed protein product, partial [Rotaria magnacalcarata]
PRNTVNDSTIPDSPPSEHDDNIRENDDHDPFLDPKYQYIVNIKQYSNKKFS